MLKKHMPCCYLVLNSYKEFFEDHKFLGLKTMLCNKCYITLFSKSEHLKLKIKKIKNNGIIMADKL